MENVNYYQIIKGSEMYYPWYVHKLEKENKALRLLLEWAEECDFGFDQIAADDDFDQEAFYKETKNMNYIDKLIYYAERWLEKNDPDERS